MPLTPRLANVPVVLSNNDGCAVARSNEVKALGVKMGAPWFQMKALARQHGIVALSSNYTLYGDMSNRVVSILREFSPDIEVYSIDESFLRVETVDHLYGGATAMGQGHAPTHPAMDKPARVRWLRRVQDAGEVC